MNIRAMYHYRIHLGHFISIPHERRSENNYQVLIRLQNTFQNTTKYF